MKKSKSGKEPKPGKLDKGAYYEKLAALQLELNEVARWLQHTGKRLVVVIEGRDTAGKGGVISAMAETLNPRQCRTVALAKPSDQEKTQWYFQRYVPHLPGAGEIVLFDRSWYNRAGVERVMNFCTPDQHAEFIAQAPLFEQMLVNDGISLTKKLRENPKFKATPILILTTESSDQMKQAGRAAGATGWLVKPFDPAKLVEVIGKVIR